MQLRIVTPEGTIYNSEEVVGVTLPTAAGIITAYDDHEPLLTVLVPGEINIEKKDHTVDLVVTGGVVRIMRDSIVEVIAETAERAEEIDLAKAEEAKQRAEEYLKQQENISDVEFARIQAAIEKELLKIDLATRYKGRGARATISSDN